MLATSGALSGDEAAASGAEVEVSGTIASIAQAVIDGNSHFYVTLEGDSAIYDFALPDMLEIVRHKVGDFITFNCAKAVDGSDGAAVRSVTKFGASRASKNADVDEGGNASTVTGALQTATRLQLRAMPRAMPPRRRGVPTDAATVRSSHTPAVSVLQGRCVSTAVWPPGVGGARRSPPRAEV